MAPLGSGIPGSEMSPVVRCSAAGPSAAVCGETLVWGPGSIAQAHTPDEYVEAAALETGAAVLRRFLLAAARG